MKLSRVLPAFITLLVTFSPVVIGAQSDTTRSFNIGYFEAGPYPIHSLLRAEFYSQLEQLLPDGYVFATVPQGFRSADWKRDTCRLMARQLVSEKSVDIVLAVGPWVVQDLLEAGFKRPIIAMHQFDPELEGLLGADGRPIAENLTVHHRPDKLYQDLAILTRLVGVKRLGFLYFPSADESQAVLREVEAIGERLGFEVVTSEGYDNFGTYAFFKSFKSLEQDIDAVYLPPLWGLKTTNLGQFLELVSDSKIPAMTSEGKMILEKGAFATGSFYSAISEARFAASKAVSIMQGSSPSELPVTLRGGLGLAVNDATARKCGIELSEEVLSDFYVVEASPGGDVSYFSLSDAVNRAASLNPGYLAGHEALAAAAQAASQAYSDYLPHLYGTAALTHWDDNLAYNYRDLVRTDQFYASLRLEQQIFSLETIKEIQVASKRHDLERTNMLQTQLDLELAVSLAYLNYLRAAEVLRALVANRSLIEHNLELAQAKAELDEGDSLDVIRLEDARYQATMRVIDARANMKVATVMLNALFNLPGNEPLVLDSVSFSEESFLRNESVFYQQVKDRSSQREVESRLMAEAAALNPAIQNMRTRLEIQKGLLSKNASRFWPSVGVEAALNFSDWLEETPTFAEENTTWSVTGFLRLPIFLGGDRFRERARLEAAVSELEYRQDDVSLEVMKNVQTNLHQFVAAMSRVTPSFQSRKRARQVLDHVVPEYSSGKTRLLELLDAQSNALTAEIGAISARYAYYEAAARLVHAVGWTVHDDYSSFIDEFHSRLAR